MTVRETGRVMDVLESAYPRYYAGIDKQRQERAVIMWASAFSRDDVRLVVAAVQSFIEMDEKGFPPVPGQIKAKIRLITQRGELPESEAWSMIRKAVCNSGYESREEFDRLPPPLQKLVGSASQLREWALMDSGTLNSVVSSNILKAYRTQTAREREFNALPPDVRALIPQSARTEAFPEKKPEIMPLRLETSKHPERIAKHPERIPELKRAIREGRTPVPGTGKGDNHDGE